MNDRLTKQEQGFVKEVAKTGNATQAVLNNYDSITTPNSAGVKGYRMLRNDKIKKSIAEMIPDDLLIEKHLALLNKVDEKGEIDVQAVKAGMDMGYKVKGSYAPEKKDITFDGIIDVKDPKTIGIAQKFEEEIKNNL